MLTSHSFSRPPAAKYYQSKALIIFGELMKKTRQFSAIIEKEDDWYVSLCPELDIASQGKSIEEAIENLKEAVSLYLEDSSAKFKPLEKSFPAPFVTTFTVVV